MTDLISGKTLDGANALIESYGLDPELIAHSVGLDPKALYCPDLEISAIKVNDFFEEAAKISKDRFFGLKLARQQSFHVLDEKVKIRVQQAQTLREALSVFVDNLADHCEATSLCLLPDSDGILTCYEARGSGHIAGQHERRVQTIELGISIACHEIKGVLGNNWRPSRVQFRHSAPADLEPLKRVFGHNLFFNQDVNAFYLTTEECDQQWGNQNSQKGRTNSLGDKEDKDELSWFLLTVKQVVIKLLNSDGCSVQKVADTLGMKLRTFQHRLSQANQSYQNIYDDIRFDLAKEYLCGSNLTIIAISDRLHFTDPTTFSRFFKRRAGVSPAAFRKSLP